MNAIKSIVGQISDAAKDEPDSFATLVLSGLMTVLALIVLF
jgi:hypothetical protein